MLNVVIDDRDIRKMANKLAAMGRGMPRKVAAAINKGLEETKPIAEQLISSHYNVPTPSLTIEKASGGNLNGAIRASGGMQPVSDFSPTSSGGPIGQTVSVEIIRGQRKSILPTSRGAGRGAFMIGDGRVMERRQDERFPIYPVSTIGIPQMFGSRKVSNPAREDLSLRVSVELIKLWLASI